MVNHYGWRDTTPAAMNELVESFHNEFKDAIRLLSTCAPGIRVWLGPNSEAQPGGCVKLATGAVLGGAHSLTYEGDSMAALLIPARVESPDSSLLAPAASRAEAYARAAKSEATRRAYSSDWRHFSA
jgi:hypothetical protein